jgi:hypothetical protein
MIQHIQSSVSVKRAAACKIISMVSNIPNIGFKSV